VAARPATTTVKGIGGLSAVACPAATACVTVGTAKKTLSGKSAVITAPAGTVKTWSGTLTNEPLNAVACPIKTKCLAVADDAVASVTVRTGAMKVTATPPKPASGIVALDSIACAGSKSCYAVGFQGTPGATQAVLVHTSAAGALLTDTVEPGTGMGAIACPSATLCLASDYDAGVTSIDVFESGTLEHSNPMPANTYVQSLRCKGSSCYALAGNSSTSQTDEVFPVNATTGVPGAAVPLGSFDGTGLTCISAKSCLVVGFSNSGASAVYGVVTVDDGAASSPVTLSGTSFSAIACATTTLCYAVGSGPSGAIVDSYVP